MDRNEQFHARCLFDLSTRKVYHASVVTNGPVSSYLAISPLSRQGQDGIFSVALAVPRQAGAFLLGSTVLCVVRTFLSVKIVIRTER
jgi:hypothetical protein